MTPGASGGSPAMAHRRSDQALMCAPMSDVGVQEARTSIWASDPSAAISPKPSVCTTVTLPLAAM
jgi:hypothetical protein